MSRFRSRARWLLAQRSKSSLTASYTGRLRVVTVAVMAVDRTRTLRGALAGATAAAVWAAQQPLDRRVFGVEYDDADLLGRFVTRGRAAYPVGLALHLVNGALFGAAYANVRPSLPVPAALRGPLAGLVEHVVTWPGTAAIGRARPELPPLWGSGRAFAQATWRHLLFGAVLGEVERRLNPPDTEPRPVDATTAASNGHGSAEHLVSISPD
jgi:hypothetical protein